MSKLTAIGLYNYDPTLFDGLTFPDGINKDIAVNEILMKSGEFEVLYPDPRFFKVQIDFWGRKHYRTFDKWVKALAIEYDPLFNYDRTEEYTDMEARQNAGNNSSTTSATNSTNDNVQVAGTNSETQSTSQVNDIDKGSTEEHTVSAYDSATYSPNDKTTISETEDATITTQLAGNGTNNTNTIGTSSQTTSGSTSGQSASSENRTLSHSAHLFGNMGVTTSQEMLKDELDIQRFNLYEQIADLFVEEFCLMIY